MADSGNDSKSPDSMTLSELRELNEKLDRLRQEERLAVSELLDDIQNQKMAHDRDEEVNAEHANLQEELEDQIKELTNEIKCIRSEEFRELERMKTGKELEREELRKKLDTMRTQDRNERMNTYQSNPPRRRR